MITDNLHTVLQEDLNPGETLLWTGAPPTGVIFRASDIFLIPFSLIWCSFAVFWVFMAARGGGIFALFGVPFVLVGFMLVFGRFIVDARQRANTVYGLTQHRIIIKSGILSKSVQSINIKTLSNIELTEKNDGTGTILLGPRSPYMMRDNTMSWWPGVKSTPQLEMISNVRNVYRQIIDIQNKAQQQA